MLKSLYTRISYTVSSKWVKKCCIFTCERIIRAADVRKLRVVSTLQRHSRSVVFKNFTYVSESLACVIYVCVRVIGMYHLRMCQSHWPVSFKPGMLLMGFACASSNNQTIIWPEPAMIVHYNSYSLPRLALFLHWNNNLTEISIEYYLNVYKIFKL